MVDNPYSEEDKRERLLNHAINIKVERNMYTTPITLELGQKGEKLHHSGQTSLRCIR